jgi:Predicted membrane protein (DUF2232)
MVQIGLIGLGAGAAAALLFASLASGSLLSIFLFYLAPLPIMLAVLGWSHWAGLVAAAVGALALVVAFGGTFFFAFIAGVAVPAWWLGYLAMLARPVAQNGAAATLEWYPPGRLVLWSAALAALVVMAAIPNFGSDADSFRAGLHQTLVHILSVDTDAPTDAASKIDRLIDFLVIAIPPAAAVLATITNVLNLWLAGRIVRFSGQLKRPWPQLSAMTFPRPVAALLVAGVALSFVDGLLGILAGVVSSSLLMAYGVLGFAVLHTITRGMNARPFVIGSVYGAVMVFGWPVLALCALGLIETGFDLRARLARRRGPPAPT